MFHTRLIVSTPAGRTQAAIVYLFPGLHCPTSIYPDASLNTPPHVKGGPTCKMSLVVRKPVFGVSDQVRHNPGCTATEDG